MSIYAAGIDIGGTNTKIGIVSDRGEILSRKVIRTFDYRTPELFKSEIIKILNESAGSFGPEISGIGIGAPNANYYTGCIEFAPNLPWKGIIDLVKGLDYSGPVRITNDANAAAVGEKLFGAARDFTDFITVTLGTGVGGGIFCDSKLLYGKFGMAGEIGHVVSVPGGRKCNCGRKGCIERYCAAGGLVETALELVNTAEYGKSSLKGFDSKTLTTKIIYDAAIEGDAAALKTFDMTACYLASFLSDLVNLFSPEAIIISGGVAKSGSVLLDPLEKYFRNDLMEYYAGKEIRLMRSALPEQDAAIIGAASLAFQELKG